MMFTLFEKHLRQLYERDHFSRGRKWGRSSWPILTSSSSSSSMRGTCRFLFPFVDTEALTENAFCFSPFEERNVCLDLEKKMTLKGKAKPALSSIKWAGKIILQCRERALEVWICKMLERWRITHQGWKRGEQCFPHFLHFVSRPLCLFLLLFPLDVRSYRTFPMVHKKPDKDDWKKSCKNSVTLAKWNGLQTISIKGKGNFCLWKKKILFVNKNINRTFLHSFQNVARRHFFGTFLHKWLATGVKKC